MFNLEMYYVTVVFAAPMHTQYEAEGPVQEVLASCSPVTCDVGGSCVCVCV